MAQYINTNISSLNAQNNLNKSQNSLQTALQRLSSGTRINSAKDDAAGLGIANRLNAQIKGLNQASRNANDGVSLAQTAEGALNTMADNLQRMRELAVQSANASNTGLDRAALQAEASQIAQELDRVATTTQFNGTNLLDGSFKSQTFQIGANAGQTLNVNMASARSADLGTGAGSALSSAGTHTAAAAGGTTMASGDIIINGVTVGASSASSDNASSKDGSMSAIAKAAAINAVSDQTGVTAQVNTNTAAGASMTAVATDGVMRINGVTTGTISTTTDGTASRAAVIQAINAISDRTGVIATDGGSSAGGVKLSAVDGRNIFVSASTVTSASTGVQTGMQYGSFTLSSSKEFTIAATATGKTSNAGLTAGTYAPGKASTTANAAGTATALAAGDVVINGVTIGSSLKSDDSASTVSWAASAIAKAAAINRASEQTGVTATATNSVDGSAMTKAAAAGNMVINGVTTATIVTSATDSGTTRAAVISAINAISGRTGVTAVDSGSSAGGVKLVAADGRNIDIDAGTTAMTSAATGVKGAGGVAAVVGKVTLSSAKSFTVEAGSTTAGTTNLGIGVGTYGASKTGQSISSIDLSTAEGATAALTAIDNALQQIDAQRGELGALQNRFASTVSNLQTSSENLTASRSRILDADFAAETASLTRGQILQQAGTAMLAQANQLPNGVLSLLR